MEFQQIKQLSQLPSNTLTAKLVGLARTILLRHDANVGLAPFNWSALQFAPDGWSLCLSDVAEIELTEEVRQCNYCDYAAVVYCVSTAQMFPGSMSLDAESRIQEPVLREIVLTICRRNVAVDSLMRKLREPYVDERTFFENYTSASPNSDSESHAYTRQAQNENATFGTPRRVEHLPTKMSVFGGWSDKVWVFVVMALCAGLYKACKISDSYRVKVPSIHVSVPRLPGGLHQHLESAPNLSTVDFNPFKSRF